MRRDILFLFIRNIAVLHAKAEAQLRDKYKYYITKAYTTTKHTYHKGQRRESYKPPNERWHPEERHHHNIERRYWRFSTIFTLFAVVVAFASVVISNETLKEARITTGKVSEQVTEAKLQTGEYKRQADAAVQSLPRAYLAIENVIYTERPDSPVGKTLRNVYLNWRIKNYGAPMAILDRINARVYSGPHIRTPDPFSFDGAFAVGSPTDDITYYSTFDAPPEDINKIGYVRYPVFINENKNIRVGSAFGYTRIRYGIKERQAQEQIDIESNPKFQDNYVLIIVYYHDVTGVSHVTSAYFSMWAASGTPADIKKYTCWDEQCKDWIKQPLP